MRKVSGHVTCARKELVISRLCARCQKLVHKQCNGVKGSLTRASTSLACKHCNSGLIVSTANVNEDLDISDGVSLEKVNKFSYLGDMMSTTGG